VADRALQTSPIERSWRGAQALRPSDQVEGLSREDSLTLSLHERPKLRSDCERGGVNAERPCPWAGCRHHLGVEVNQESGSLNVLEGWDDGGATCAIDVAAQGEATLEERIRQIEVRALLRIRRKPDEDSIALRSA
jgi:hypothetical protein